MKKTIILFFVTGLFATTSCTEKNNSQTEEKFPVAVPRIRDTTYTNEYVADIQSLQNVEIRSRIKGYMEKLHVDEGQMVAEGQVLFTISSKEYQQNLQKAKSALKNALAELKSAEIELHNTQKLADKNIVAKPELEMMKAKVEAMKAKVEEAESNESQAELQLSFTEIKAPYDGIINRIPKKRGSLVEEGMLLTSISNNKEMVVYFKVSETDYLSYISAKKDSRLNAVTLILADNSLYEHEGRIETVEGEFDKSTGNIAFRARFPNPEQILKHGSSGKIFLKKNARNAIIIPQKSTFEIQGNYYVYVLKNDNSVELRKIIPYVHLPHLYIISGGLAKGEKFIYEGIQKLKEGQKIKPVDSQPDEYKTAERK